MERASVNEKRTKLLRKRKLRFENIVREVKAAYKKELAEF
jgi:hypothetical protein